MAEALAAVALSVVFFTKNTEYFLYFIVIVSASVIIDALLIRIRHIPPFLLSAAVVTGLIVGLLYSPNYPWYEGLTAIGIAIAGKNFLRINDRHIFNPAALGVMIAAAIFHRSVSWWGESYQILFSGGLPALLFILLLLPGYVSVIRLKRYRITASFLLTYFLLVFAAQFFHGSISISSIIVNTILNPATIFFALVMLPEPMTTPNTHSRQLLFGTSVAFISIMSTFFRSLPIADPLLAGLLLSNVLFFTYR